MLRATAAPPVPLRRCRSATAATSGLLSAAATVLLLATAAASATAATLRFLNARLLWAAHGICRSLRLKRAYLGSLLMQLLILPRQARRHSVEPVLVAAARCCHRYFRFSFKLLLLLLLCRPHGV